MSYVIIDKRAGNAEVCCDEYGDYAMFETHEAAESFRALHCDGKRSYVFPRETNRISVFDADIIGVLQSFLKRK